MCSVTKWVTLSLRYVVSFWYSMPKNNPRLLHSKDYTRDILHTRQHGHHKPANSNSNQIICVSAHSVTFQYALIRNCMRHHCAPYSSKSQFLIYMWLFPHICHFMLSNRKSKRSAISTDPRRLLIDLCLINCLDFIRRCLVCLCLYLIIKFKPFI